MYRIFTLLQNFPLTSHARKKSGIFHGTVGKSQLQDRAGQERVGMAGQGWGLSRSAEGRGGPACFYIKAFVGIEQSCLLRGKSPAFSSNFLGRYQIFALIDLIYFHEKIRQIRGEKLDTSCSTRLTTKTSISTWRASSSPNTTSSPLPSAALAEVGEHSRPFKF